jgi:hypothetical protein
MEAIAKDDCSDFIIGAWETSANVFRNLPVHTCFVQLLFVFASIARFV